MARIQLDPGATAEQVMRTVRDTCESRGYHWEQTTSDRAIASEGGTPVSTAALPVAQRLRVSVRVHPAKRRLVLGMETIGAAYSAAGGGWVYVQLAFRYRKLVKAVRTDLAVSAPRR